MRVKHSSTQVFKHTSEVKLPQRLSLNMLDLICSYLVSDNRNIRRKGYANIKAAISTLDMNVFKDNEYILRFDFIDAALEARLKYGIDNKVLAFDHVKTKLSSFGSIKLTELSNNEVNYVNDTITNMLDNVIFAQNIGQFEDISRRFNEAGPNDKPKIVAEWKDKVASSNNAIRQNKIDKTDDEMYSLQPGVFEDYVRYTHADLSSVSNKLATGIIQFNAMLNGGWQSDRTYCIFGLQGEGKSSTLVDMAIQIKRYNKNYVCKDPTKRPCVVYLTMEDHPKETLSRQFSMVTQQGQMTDFEVNEAIDMMRHSGLEVTPDDPIDIIVKYKPNESVDTSYIYDMVDDLADMGYECICVILDYLNRIRSINRFNASEERLRLGAVVNELKTIATDLHIPIITAAQFNREANNKIDESRGNGNSDLVELLGRSYIAESMKILDNLDGAFLIVPEWPNKQKKYLGIKLVKNRWRSNFERNVIHHPYVDTTSQKLVEDVSLGIPASKITTVEMQLENDGPDMLVEGSMEVPDNSNRYHHTPATTQEDAKYQQDVIKETMKEKVGMAEQNPAMKLINGNFIPNADALSKEEKEQLLKEIERRRREANDPVLRRQAEERIRLEQNKDNVNPYSEEYTRLYDPMTTKMERRVRDFNMQFSTNLKPEDYPMLMNHLYMVRESKNALSGYGRPIREGIDMFLMPFVRIEPSPIPPFSRYTDEERENYVVKWPMQIGCKSQ